MKEDIEEFLTKFDIVESFEWIEGYPRLKVTISNQEKGLFFREKVAKQGYQVVTASNLTPTYYLEKR